MKNYINVRTQSYNNSKTLNNLKHNLRYVKSLSEDKRINNRLVNFLSEDINRELGSMEQIKVERKKLLSEYKTDRERHNKLFKAHAKQNLREYNATWFEGVFTFSEKLKEDLGTKYSQQDLINVANNCLKEIAKIYKAEIRYMVFHLDETTPHFHFTLTNFDDRGLSLFGQNKNKEFLSNLQDIGFKHFGTLGMERGVSKNISEVNHISIKKFHEQEYAKLRDLIKNSNASLKLLNLEVTRLNRIKSETKSDLSKPLEQLKAIQQEEQNARARARDLKQAIRSAERFLEEYNQLVQDDKSNHLLNKRSELEDRLSKEIKKMEEMEAINIDR